MSLWFPSPAVLTSSDPVPYVFSYGRRSTIYSRKYLSCCSPWSIPSPPYPLGGIGMNTRVCNKKEVFDVFGPPCGGMPLQSPGERRLKNQFSRLAGRFAFWTRFSEGDRNAIQWRCKLDWHCNNVAPLTFTAELLHDVSHIKRLFKASLAPSLLYNVPLTDVVDSIIWNPC